MNSKQASESGRRCRALLGRLAVLLWLGGAGLLAGAQPAVVTCGHSHNDYRQPHPLRDALDSGLCSVEADIHLVNGQLLVAHDRAEVRTNGTLASLYLEPLRARVRANAGHVYSAFGTNAALARPLADGAPPVEFTLLIDIKGEAQSAYHVLREQLAGFQEMLTHFTPTSTVPGAVTVMLTGNHPGPEIGTEPNRLCALDGRISDLDANPSVHLYPLVSENWRTVFGHPAPEQLGPTELEKLRLLVARAHQQDRRLRFWGAADTSPAWQALSAAGVDLINTDKPAGLARFIFAQAQKR